MSILRKEYCYTMDYKFYSRSYSKKLNSLEKEEWLIETKKSFTQITREEYKEKTGESDYIIDKLRNSVFPPQRNDYFFLKVPIPVKDKLIYAPIDWRIYNLVKYLNQNNIVTGFSNQDLGPKRNIVKIIIEKNYKKLIAIFEEKLGKENLINKKINISVSILTFDKNHLKWIYNKLDLTYPDHSKAHKGKRILSNYIKEKFNL